MKTSITIERLRHLLDFDAESGDFFWKNPTSNRVAVGDRAGCRNKKIGYVVLSLDKTFYYAHRLVWLWTTGSFPIKQMDHRNGIRHDNRFENLREADDAQNNQNKIIGPLNTSGYVGASWSRHTEKWVAQIAVGRVHHYLGLYENVEDAHAAYLAAKERLHTFQPIPRDLAK